MAETTILAQVVYAEAGQQTRLEVLLPEGSTVSDAIKASGIATMIPEGSIDACQCGIFARKVTPDHVLTQGDRVEIYRPLAIEPMDARRRRAR